MDNVKTYLVYYCAGCIAIRHFKYKKDNIYYCPVCGLEVYYIDGRIMRKEK